MILEGIKLTKRFGGLVAVDNFTFNVEEGEILGIIGPNGAGKSTLLNIISGVYFPDSGRIVFKGKDITRLGPDKRCKLGIGRTFQLLSLIHHFTVIDNVMIGSIFGRSNELSLQEAKKVAIDALEFVGLAKKLDSPLNVLSTMELKKVELARALATKPELLLLDEIMAGLTMQELDEFIHLVKSINENDVTVVLVEHIMHVVKKLSDRVICMDQGKKIAEGDYETVASSPEVVKAYLGEEYAFA